MQDLPKIIAVLGPTASGKSALAVELARKFNGEIISADSRQVYRGLDIGTGKITVSEMRGIPHHLLSVASPRSVFTAAEYVKKARRVIDSILERGKLPIVCGGTGFYIDALLGAAVPAPVPPNMRLRKTLEKEPLPALVEKLKKIDPAYARKVDAKNRRRLVRAIEIAEALGKVPASKSEQFYDALKIGMAIPHEELKKKITARLRARLKAGMANEARRLHEEGLSWKRMEGLGLEYRFLARYLQKKITKEEMLAQLETAINQYAKRQMTWWKRDKTIQWFSPDERAEIKKRVRGFLGQKAKSVENPAQGFAFLDF